MKSRLGIDTYANQEKTPNALIDLSWTTDENHFLSLSVCELINNLLLTEINNPNALWTKYPVMDPYDSNEILSSAVKQFNTRLTATQVTVGTGVTSLICHLTKIKTDAFQIFEPAYLDFSHWLSIANKKHIITDVSAKKTEKYYFLEHPNFYNDCDEVLDLISNIQSQHNEEAIIIIDESNANYLSPDQSAVRLVNEVPGVVVLRGFSKAYGLGSLRLGVCISSPNISQSIRSLFPPLAFTPTSLRVARILWENGDIQKGLRTRISSAREKFLPIFNKFNELSIIPSNPALPYVIFNSDSKEFLDSIGVQTKLHTMSVSPGNVAIVCRLSLPLLDERQKILHSILEK